MEPLTYPTYMLYKCCEVTAKALIGEPCWNCKELGPTVSLADLPHYHPWNRFLEATPSQRAAPYYL